MQIGQGESLVHFLCPALATRPSQAVVVVKRVLQTKVNRIRKNVTDTLQIIKNAGVTVGQGSDALPAAASALVDKMSKTATIRSGSGAPDDSLGVDGDIYLML